MFSTEASKAISDEYVAVRLLGGNDITPEVERVMSIYGVQGYPTMLVVNQDGLRLNEEPVGRSVDAILGAMKSGATTDAEIAKAKSGDAKAYEELLKKHDGWETLVGIVEPRAAKEPTADNHIALQEAYARLGRTEDAEKLLGTMIETHKDHADRPDWRVAKATSMLASIQSREEAVTKFGQAIDALTALSKTAEEEKDLGTQLASRVRLGQMLQQSHGLLSRGPEAKPHFDYVLEKGKDTKYGAGALMGLANVHFAAKELEEALTYLERIVAEYPDSEEAKIAPRGIANVKRMLGK